MAKDLTPLYSWEGPTEWRRIDGHATIKMLHPRAFQVGEIDQFGNVTWLKDSRGRINTWHAIDTAFAAGMRVR